MSFSAADVLGFFALPSNLLMTLALLGVLLMRTPAARFGRRLAVAGLLLLAICGWLPVGNWLMAPLEQRFPAWDPARGAPDGIIVLGGAISPDVSAAHGSPALNESAERLTAVADLARRFPAARIVFTGGAGRSERSEASHARPLLESFGVAGARIELESEARNTFENATRSKAQIDPRYGERWLLVTSAHHMPRAVGLFRQAGFPVEAYPVDFRIGGREAMLSPFASLAAGLARTDTAAREWAGLLLAWLSGRSPDPFPRP